MFDRLPLRMSGRTTIPDCSGVMTASMSSDWRGLLARMTATDRGRVSLRKSFARDLAPNETGLWLTLGPDERGSTRSIRTNWSCETLLRNSTNRGRENDWIAPSGCSLGGRTEVLCSLLSGEEGYRRREACCLGRFGILSSSS